MTRSLLLGSLMAFAIACSGADDGTIDPAPAPATTAPAAEPPPAPSAPDSVETKTPSDTPKLPGSPAPAPGPTKPKDAFDGAPAYAMSLGATTRQSAHAFNSNTPKTNPAGKVCLNCHRAGGSAPAFAAAGTVYDGTKPAAGVEVRAIGKGGEAASSYTDADGNFFFRNDVQPIAFPALVGVRNAKGTRLMASAPPKGSCNECHSTTGGAGHISVTP